MSGETKRPLLPCQCFPEFRGAGEGDVNKLRDIFAEGELDPAATVKEFLTVQTEGNRLVSRSLTLYNLDAILAVGYRVRSPRGVQFRRWASTVLKEYLLKGFVMDDERLKNPVYEMLARIRDIRASEKRFSQKVRDLFALSSDYDVCRREALNYISQSKTQHAAGAARGS